MNKKKRTRAKLIDAIEHAHTVLRLEEVSLNILNFKSLNV